MYVILISLATFVSTLLGGLFALRFKDKLHLILGFSAGAVIGVAFFDLLPEAISIGGTFYSTETALALSALGFLIYLLLDRAVFIHLHADERDETGEVKKNPRGTLGAASLSLHSLLDGVAIGLSFQVSAAIGAVVAVAVLCHDFSDGINTVGFILKHQGGGRSAFRWLLVDAFAPLIGAVSTLFFSVPEKTLGVILALFAGFFLYIGASDLIPEGHHSHHKLFTTGMTIAGAGLLYVIVQFAGL